MRGSGSDRSERRERKSSRGSDHPPDEKDKQFIPLHSSGHKDLRHSQDRSHRSRSLSANRAPEPAERRHHLVQVMAAVAPEPIPVPEVAPPVAAVEAVEPVESLKTSAPPRTSSSPNVSTGTPSPSVSALHVNVISVDPQSSNELRAQLDKLTDPVTDRGWLLVNYTGKTTIGFQVLPASLGSISPPLDLWHRTR